MNISLENRSHIWKRLKHVNQGAQMGSLAKEMILADTKLMAPSHETRMEVINGGNLGNEIFYLAHTVRCSINWDTCFYLEHLFCSISCSEHLPQKSAGEICLHIKDSLSH